MSKNANDKPINPLQEIKDVMRLSIKAELKKSGMSETLINECRELAGNGVRLLALMEKHGFAETLDKEDRAEFNEIMQGLSLSGIRCQLLVEESYQDDYQQFLASAPAPSLRAN